MLNFCMSELSKRFKDGFYQDYSKNVYRMWFEYLKVCLNNPELFQVNEEKYSSWKLKNVRNLKFDKWWASQNYGNSLFGYKKEVVREINSINSYKPKTNTTIIEVPLNLNIQENLDQIKEILKPKRIKLDRKVFGISDIRSTKWLNLEIYLDTWKMKNIEKMKFKEIREKLIKVRRSRLENRKGRQKIAMSLSKLNQFLIDNQQQRGEKTYQGDMESILRQLSRFNNKAQKILENTAKGTFPGKYYFDK